MNEDKVKPLLEETTELLKILGKSRKNINRTEN
jgi:hypothetical protein